MRKIRVAIISDLPYPHWRSLWCRLAASPEIELTVLICSKPVGNRRWRPQFNGLPFRCELMWGITIPLHPLAPDAWYMHVNPQIITVVLSRKFDIFLTVGWTYPTTLAVLALRKWHKKPVVLWDEAIPHPPTWLKRVLTPLIRKILASYDGYLTAGPRTAEYLASYGADLRKTYVVGQAAVDRAFFERELKIAREKKEEIKKKIAGSPDKKVVLFSGQLIVRKGVLILVEAFRRVKREFAGAALVILGTGPLKAKILAYLTEKQIDDVILAGFLPPEEFISYYAIADLFVLPSLYDCFPIVIIEAMHSGLPIVTTRQVGSVGNLVLHGENGLVVEPGDPEQLAHAMLRLLTDQELREKMGREASRLVETYSVEQVAEKMVQAFIAIASKAETM